MAREPATIRIRRLNQGVRVEQGETVTRKPGATPLTEAWLREVVAQLLAADPAGLDPKASVFDLGLESIAIMRVANLCRRAGAKVKFSALAQAPTIEQWAALVGGPAEPAPVTGAAPGRTPTRRSRWRRCSRRTGWAGWTVSRSAASARTSTPSSTARASTRGRLESAVPGVVAPTTTCCAPASCPTGGNRDAQRRSPWPGLTVHDLRGEPPRRGGTHRAARPAVPPPLRDGGRRGLRRPVVAARRRAHPHARGHRDARGRRAELPDDAVRPGRLYTEPETPLEPLRTSFAGYLADRGTAIPRRRPRPRNTGSTGWTSCPGRRRCRCCRRRSPAAHAGVERRFRQVPPARRAALTARLAPTASRWPCPVRALRRGARPVGRRAAVPA